MAGLDWIKQIPKVLVKYKYVVAVIAAGIVLMTIPAEDKELESTESALPVIEISLEERLSQILSKINGAGEVSVLLSTSSGEEYIYQNNTDVQSNEENHSSQMDTVIISDSGRNEQGLLRQIISPKYLGAIVVCQGADNPVVKLSVVEAVANATGLGADKITVLKMK